MRSHYPSHMTGHAEGLRLKPLAAVVLSLPAIAAASLHMAGIREASPLLVIVFTAVLYVAKLVADDLRLRRQTRCASTILRAVAQGHQSRRVHLVLPGVMELDCDPSEGSAADMSPERG